MPRVLAPKLYVMAVRKPGSVNERYNLPLAGEPPNLETLEIGLLDFAELSMHRFQQGNKIRFARGSSKLLVSSRVNRVILFGIELQVKLGHRLLCNWFGAGRAARSQSKARH